MLRDASGKKMEVNGVSYIYVDLYEGKHVRNSPSTRTRICVIVSSSLNSNEELLLEKLRLIPKNWPYVHDYTDCRKSELSQEDAEEIISRVQQGTMERCLKVEKEAGPSLSGHYRGYESKEAYLYDHLWSSTGSVEDIPRLDELPEEIHQILYQYFDIFCTSLPRGRRIKVKPVDIVIDPEVPKPELCLRPQPMPAHWQPKVDNIIDNLLEAGHMSHLEKVGEFLSPSFHITKPGLPEMLSIIINYSRVNACICRLDYCTQSTDEITRVVGPGNKFFIAMDQTSRYFQVPIREETKAVIVFVTPNRDCFTFNCLPMGH